MSYFLVVFDRRSRRITRLDEFAAERPEDALHARFECEFAARDDPDTEVVLFSADSLDALRRTHSRYFFREDAIRQHLGAGRVLTGAK